MPFAQVALPARVFRPFAYAIPSGMEVVRGARVVVPFHRGRRVGFVIGIDEKSPEGLAPKNIKAIEDRLGPDPVFSSAILDLIAWIARRYCAPIGEVCRMALPARLCDLRAPRSDRAATPHELGHAPSRGSPPDLNAEQRAALDALLRARSDPTPRPALLHGITGSGKTEIYLRLVKEIVAEGGGAILLVPEIGLVPQLASRVIGRFGADAVAVYHSGLTDAQRAAQWERMRRGEARIVIGTRSALFAPIPNVRLIAIDEEHDHSYKQEEGVLYHAREAAIERARLEKTLCLLGSATPSVETFARAQQGAFHYLPLGVIGTISK